MERREFIRVAGVGFMTMLISGCTFWQQDAAQQIKSEGGSLGMKITVITGSPHEHGTSFLLADKFIEGAEAAGHEVYRFNAAFEETNPCVACERCRGTGRCVYNDAVSEELIPHVREADMVVFITPLYYYGMSSHLKIVVDRLHAINGELAGKNKQSILMATSHNSDDWTMTALQAHYEAIVRHFGWKDQGRVLAVGCGVREQIEASEFPQRALEIGQSIRA